MAKTPTQSPAQRMHALMIGQPNFGVTAKPRPARVNGRFVKADAPDSEPAIPAEPHPLLGPAFNKPRVD